MNVLNTTELFICKMALLLSEFYLHFLKKLLVHPSSWSQVFFEAHGTSSPAFYPRPPGHHEGLAGHTTFSRFCRSLEAGCSILKMPRLARRMFSSSRMAFSMARTWAICSRAAWCPTLLVKGPVGSPR